MENSDTKFGGDLQGFVVSIGWLKGAVDRGLDRRGPKRERLRLDLFGKVLANNHSEVFMASFSSLVKELNNRGRSKRNLPERLVSDSSKGGDEPPKDSFKKSNEASASQ
jgi:hypothetical protein